MPDCLPKALVSNEVAKGDEKVSVQVIGKISSDGWTKMPEVNEVESNLNNLSMPSLSGKRKHSKGVETELNCEVSKSSKRARTTGYDDKVTHDD